MKILIVDDEKMIRNWLAMLLRQIPDKDIEIAVAGNVDEALDHCRSNEVHLVITDITMPQRSGLELLEILRHEFPNIYTAVLSAYDDYQYIRSAMQLGAIDYILKAEMELSDILSVLRKVEIFSGNVQSMPHAGIKTTQIDELNLEDQLLDSETLTRFLANGIPSFQANDFMVYMFTPEDNENIRITRILETCNKTLASEGLVGGTFWLKDAFCLIYNVDNASLERQEEVQRKLSLLLERNVLTLVRKKIRREMSFHAENIDLLRNELKGYLLKLRCRQYYVDAETKGSFQSLHRSMLIPVIKKLRFLLEIRRYGDAAEYLMQSVEEFHRAGTDPEDLKAAIYHFITIIFLNTAELQNDLVFASHYQNLNRQLNQAGTSQEVSSLVEQICTLYKSEVRKSKRTIMNPSLKSVVEYVDKNYMCRLTLENVASNVFLNKTYISQMFMKHLGISFVNYLESVRIHKAQELLRNTELSVTKIAEETGYASQSYFTKAFKKRIGMSPLQYRSVSLNDEFSMEE